MWLSHLPLMEPAHIPLMKPQPAIHSLYSIYTVLSASSLSVSTWLTSALHSSLSSLRIYNLRCCLLLVISLYSTVSTWYLLLFTLCIYLVVFFSNFSLSVSTIYMLFTLSTVSTVPSASSLSVSTWLHSALHSPLSLSTSYMAASCNSLSLQYLLYLVPLHSPYLPGAFRSSLLTLPIYNLLVHGCILLFTLSTVSTVPSASLISVSTWLTYVLHSSLSVSTWCLLLFLLFTLHSPYIQATWLPPAIHSLSIVST
jgi:hypothetical protein